MLLEGKQVQEKLLNELNNNINSLADKMSLVVIQVGNDEASNIYIKQKELLANRLNINFKHLVFDYIEEKDVLKEIENLNKDKKVTGIIVQLPLPKNINERVVTNRIDPLKDIDGLTLENIGKLQSNDKDALVPCTAKGVMDIFNYYNINLKGKKVTIIGRSKLVGIPLIPQLLNKDATVTICHSKTKDIKSITKLSDIIIIGIGKPNFLTKDYIKKDAIIIDVGINRLNNKITGDVDMNSVKDMVSMITPVPKGVGVLTTTNIFINLYKAYLLQNNIK